jgi:hypothetical protein
MKKSLVTSDTEVKEHRKNALSKGTRAQPQSQDEKSSEAPPIATRRAPSRPSEGLSECAYLARSEEKRECGRSSSVASSNMSESDIEASYGSGGSNGTSGNSGTLKPISVPKMNRGNSRGFSRPLPLVSGVKRNASAREWLAKAKSNSTVEARDVKHRKGEIRKGKVSSDAEDDAETDENANTATSSSAAAARRYGVLQLRNPPLSERETRIREHSRIGAQRHS